MYLKGESDNAKHKRRTQQHEETQREDTTIVNMRGTSTAAPNVKGRHNKRSAKNQLNKP